MSEHGPGDTRGTSRLTVHIVTLFPLMFSSWLEQGVVSRAIERDLVAIDLVDLRSFGVGRHRVTDDYPFGGGVGMVLKPDPIFAAVDSLQLPPQSPVIALGPRGRRFTQRVANDLAVLPAFTLLAGHYEGIDERVRLHLVHDEISLGDFVLSNGELAAMAVTDAAVRLLPGALAAGAAEDESHGDNGLLEYPQYTRPAQFRSWAVPDVLLSGHHAEIARWRRREALRITGERRPDLLDSADVTDEERAWLTTLSLERP